MGDSKLFVLCYSSFLNDGAVEVVNIRGFKHRVRSLFSDYEPDEVDAYVKCAEVDYDMSVPIKLFDGCVYAREVIERLVITGVRLVPLTKFLGERVNLLDKDLRCLIVSKSV